MAEYINGDIILSGSESDWFMEHFLRPDPEVMRRRNAYFAKIDEMDITEEDGVVSFEIPDIDFGDSYCVEIGYSPTGQNPASDNFHNWLDAIQLEIKSFNDMHERKIQVNYIEQSNPVNKRAALKTLAVCA